MAWTISSTEQALDGENPSLVRRWAGHRSYEMTDYYFGLAAAQLGAITPQPSRHSLRHRPAQPRAGARNACPHVRVYQLWTRRERRPHKGQRTDALFAVPVMAIVSPSLSMSSRRK